MPSILSGLTHNFSKAVRERGRDYFESGAVEIVSSKPGFVKAHVQGTELYTVVVRWPRGGEPIATCTCPYQTEYAGPCKHVWATLLEIESGGLLGGKTAAGRRRPPAWSARLERLVDSSKPVHVAPPEWPTGQRLNYIIDKPATLDLQRGIRLELATQRQLRTGPWKPPKRYQFNAAQLLNHPDPADRQIAQMLLGVADQYGLKHHSGRFTITPESYAVLLPMLCATGRCRLRQTEKQESPPVLQWDDGPPWKFVAAVEADGEAEQYVLSGRFERDGEQMELNETDLIMLDGVVIGGGRIALLEPVSAPHFLHELHTSGAVQVPREDIWPFLKQLHGLPALPPVRTAPELAVEHQRPPMQPHLLLHKGGRSMYGDTMLDAEVTFRYGEQTAKADEPAAAFFDIDRRQAIWRDHRAEQKALRQFENAGAFRGWSTGNTLSWRLPGGMLNQAVQKLLERGWHIEGEGVNFRAPGSVNITVSSGIDWFDLDGYVDYGGQRVSIPTLLEAMRTGRRTVTLGDGSQGMLPQQWLKQHGALLSLAEETDDEHLRFKRGQIGFLDALLAAEPEANCDQVVREARRQLADFSGIHPAEAPPGFIGELRPYQKHGLGWLQFLQRFGFGGCLADDMGLGKTIQVLALLEQRREANAGPSLVIAPRSLVFNWMQEAKRFTPNLRVLDFTGIGRHSSIDGLETHDLVLTTYGTLRRDAAMLKKIPFDYVVLDEAQAIKNASTASAKAARLLQASHRLALSGTPVENRLQDLWSIFEFLNPGMLGAVGAFKSFSSGSGADDASRELLARALRPFILRRTKQQVATDLPRKLEQTIYCEMDTKQRKLYDELRDHYRLNLLQKVETVGMNKAKFMVLEALLRLRQVACHPGLIDDKRRNEPSAKLEALLEQVEEAVGEGHKVLVFSQFTSLLAIVREAFDSRQITYEYLDGKTKDRAERVARFQTDPACPLFLISLKAGGVGLNLTAADYVFLLDPWWNPAVEAQAIDRTHRIGQTKPVFAYRLIARDTVEEKVLELQASKRDLADAIVAADNTGLASMTRQDLQLLLS